MKVNVLTVLMHINGEPLIATPANKDANPPVEEVKMTLRKACVDALCGVFQGDNPDGTEKYRRWNLAKIIQKFDEPELRVDDLKLIKDMIAKAYGPIVIGPAYELLDPPAEKEKLN